MTIEIAGQTYDGVFIGGIEYSNIFFGGAEIYAKAVAPVDTLGTLTLSASRSGRNRNFTARLSDPDGVRSITSAVATASDSRTANQLSDFSRTNANQFDATFSKRQSRWNSGTLTVVYVDATTGASHTLTDTWSL